MYYKILLLISVFLSLTQSEVFPWRASLSNCWTNVTCNRALIVSHGGDWGVEYPYDSLPAFNLAYTEGSDAVKGDFRVSSDNFGVVMHSSPIQWYESPTCWGKRVENMTAAECTSCTMALTSYTFISVPELLKWSHQKVIVMLCVKRSEDIARAISTLIENGATDRAFLEVRVRDLPIVANVSGWDKVYYLAEGGSAADIDKILSKDYAWLLPRIFTFEYDPSYQSWGIDIGKSIVRLHGKGIRTFTATSQWWPSVASQEKLWDDGFDVVYTYGTQNGIIARTNIDKKRGVIPPL